MFLTEEATATSSSSGEEINNNDKYKLIYSK
jgi:hypothetical protein